MVPRNVATCRDRKISLLDFDIGTPLSSGGVDQITRFINIFCCVDAISVTVALLGQHDFGASILGFLLADAKK